MNYTRGQASFQQDLVDQVIGVDGGGGRLPDTNVANNDGRKDQVSTDSGEVERRDGQNETLERSELGSVPDSLRVSGRLLGVEFLDVLDAESEKVCQLGSRVDFRLPRVLSLAEHGSRHELVSILAGNEVGCLEEDGGLVIPGHVFPFSLGGERALDSSVEDFRGSAVNGAQVICVVVGKGLLDNVTGSDLQHRDEFL